MMIFYFEKTSPFRWSFLLTERFRFAFPCRGCLALHAQVGGLLGDALVRLPIVICVDFRPFFD